jgi:glycyl-tRNA synthetase beta chain
MATGVEDLEGLAAESPKASEQVASKPATLPLLLEVGCEEIPARFLRDAEKGLGDRIIAALTEARLIVAKGKKAAAETYSTPRRLVVYVPKVLSEQPEKIEELTGPPVKVAVDANGNYTRAAESFAQKSGASVADLYRIETPKGEYLALKKTTPGRSAPSILAEILPAAILGLAFPKSMYWTRKSDPRFVRPIRWVVALLGAGKSAITVDFEILGVRSGNYSYGHRALGSKPLTVTGFSNYVRKLAQAQVEIDYKQRMKRVVEQSPLVLTGLEGFIVQDPWLVDWIANATEWPRPMLGSFDARFLHLPREILITVMRDHQRYFAVEDSHGALRPNFVAALNMESDPKGLIRQGHERVLTARFRDAEFFWAADQKRPLRDRTELLEKVTYQARLGSYADKVRRMRSIAENLCASLEASGRLTPEQKSHVLRAVELCKCDLTAQMVQEFTELQGIVGGLYAKAQGEPEEVATAIYDHYLPAGAEGNSPRTLSGSLVSLADKIDSVVAGFAAGYEPTGSSDPFALRRQANGVIKVTLENAFAIDLRQSIHDAAEVLKIEWRKPRVEVEAKVLEFFSERLRFFFETVRGFRYDTVRAVVAAGFERPADALARAEAMEGLRGGEDFEALSAAAKRIRNILAKSATAADLQAGEDDAALLAEVQEKDLFEDYRAVAADVERLRAAGNYREALERISTLRPPVDRFFDKVLVMAEDPAVRQNRLRLLQHLDALFSTIAHFAEIAATS